MSVRKITTKFIMDGEREYLETAKKLSSEMKVLKSQMDLVQSQYAGQANTIAALTEKGKLLTETIKKLQERWDAHDKEIIKNKDTQKKAEEQTEKLRGALENKKKALDKLKASTGDTTEKQEKLEKQIKYLERAIVNSEQAEKLAVETQQRHQAAANKTKAEINNLNGELQKNDKYLDEAKRSADGCATSIDEMGKETKEAAEESDALGGKFNGALKDIQKGLAAAGITAALKVIYDTLRACAQASIEFESAMAGVAKTTDMSGEELKTMGDAIKQMATEIPLTTTELAAIAETAGQLGVAKDDLLPFTEVMANLGVATNMTSSEAATMLAQFAAITGMDTSKYGNLGSSIVALGNNFATNEQKIADFAQTVAGAAVNADMSETDMLALGAAVTSLGIESATGGANMSKLITAMQTAVETGENLDVWAQAAGVSTTELSAIWRTDAVDALMLFVDGINETDAPMATMLDQLGLGELRTSRMITSMANAEDASGTLSNALKMSRDAWSENNALTKEAETRYETAESKIQLYKNGVSNLKTTIGDSLLPILGDMAEKGARAVAWMSDFIEKYGMINPAPLESAAEKVTSLAEAQKLLLMAQIEYDEFYEDNYGILSGDVTAAGYQQAAAKLLLLEENTRAAQEAVEQFADAEIAGTEAISAANEGIEEQTQLLLAEVDAIEANIANMNAMWQENYNTVSASIEGQCGLFETLETKASATYKGIADALDSQIQWLEDYSANMESLTSRNIAGIDQFAANFADGTQDSANNLAAFATMTDDEIAAIVSKMQTVDEGTQAVSKACADLNMAVDPEFQAIKDATDEMVANFNQYGAAYSGGDATISGYIDALRSRLGELRALAADVNRAAAGLTGGGSNKAGPQNPGPTPEPLACGMDYVPYDEFPALLHKGESVLTALEAKAYRAERRARYMPTSVSNVTNTTGASVKNVSVQQTFCVPVQSPSQVKRAVERSMKEALYGHA